MGALKSQSNGPLYSNTVIGTLAVDGWAVTFGTARRGLGGLRAPPSPLLAVPNVTAHPSTASVPTSYYSMWHYVLYTVFFHYDEINFITLASALERVKYN